MKGKGQENLIQQMALFLEKDIANASDQRDREGRQAVVRYLKDTRTNFVDQEMARRNKDGKENSAPFSMPKF